MTTQSSKPIQVALIGAGTVGSGVLRVLKENSETIAIRVAPVEVKTLVVRNQAKGQAALDASGWSETALSLDWHDLVNDPDVDIVVELIGGTELAYEVISSAIRAGKSVVTANKDLMACRGGELLALAEEHQTDLFFEAAVCGGIPIIQAIKESLAANQFLEIMGIVNGTTNFILSKMSNSGADFAPALAEAQALGYAEADPTADVEGHDAARKMAILASIAFNSRVTFDMVDCEGMTKISSWDILYAKEFGYVIKMVGIARSDGQEIDVRVHPVMLPATHPLATVQDSYNAVFLRGNALGSAMFLGRGAGSLPTASAVVGDILAASRNLLHGCKARWGCTCHLSFPLRPIEETVSKYYLRVSVSDEVGVFAAMTAVLAEAGVSMDAVLQKRRLAEGGAEIVMITHPAKHKQMKHAVRLFEKLGCVRSVSDMIRVEDNLGEGNF